MTPLSNESVEMMSIKNTFRAFRHWPRIFLLLWETKKTYFIGVLLLNIMSGLAPVSILLATQTLINTVVDSRVGGFQDVLWSFLFFISVSALTELVQIAQGYLDGLLRMLLSNHINVLIMKKSILLSLADFENAKIQDQLNRAQGEASYRPYQIFQQIIGIIRGVITLLSTVAVLVLWKWWIACMIMIIPLLSFVFFLKLSQKEFLIHWRRTPKSRLLWYISFLLTKDMFFKEIKLFQLGDHLLIKYKNLFQHFYAEDKRLNRKRIKLSFFFQVVNQLVIGIAVFIILRSAFLGQILVGNVIGLIQAIGLTQTSAQNVVGNVLSLCQSNLYIEQLFTFLDIKSSESEVLERAKHATDSEIANGNEILSNIHTIEFVKVSYKYAGTNQYAVKNLNLKLIKGRIYAIVGRNGSGKSTVIKLLTLLYRDYDGDIYINGVSAQKFPINILHKKIGAIFQDFVQYEMPVRQNIGYGAIELINQDEKIFEVVQQAGLNEVIEKLPNSIDTQLGRWFEGGYQLSGGQWQRIAIGRSFIKNADIYILDEPSSFLDAQSEEDVFQRFNEVAKNKIGLFISHRLSSVRYADEIIVMENGTIVERGSHEKLLKKDNVYAKLYRLQKSGYGIKEREDGSYENARS